MPFRCKQGIKVGGGEEERPFNETLNIFQKKRGAGIKNQKGRNISDTRRGVKDDGTIC